MNHMSGTIVVYIKPHLLTNIVLYDYNQPTFSESFSHNSVVYLNEQGVEREHRTPSDSSDLPLVVLPD